MSAPRFVSGRSYARARRAILKKCFGGASRRVMPGDVRAVAVDAMTAKLHAAYCAFWTRHWAKHGKSV